MERLIPSADNSIEPNGAIGKQKCGIVFWQRTGFLRHCNELGLRSIVSLIDKKYSPSSIQANGNTYFIQFDNNQNRIIFLTLKKEINSRNLFIYGESHTVYSGLEFHLFALEIVEYISKQIGCRFFVDDATGYLKNKSIEQLKKYIEDFQVASFESPDLLREIVVDNQNQ